MTTKRILLIGGLWLDTSAWAGVLEHLEDATPVALPGQGDGNTAATLDDQVAAVLAAVDAEPGPVVVAGHSAACSLAWIAADARPEKVAKVVMIGGFPWADGQQYFPFIPATDGAVRFAGWEAFEGPDSADIDEEQRAAFAAAAIPVPEGVTSATVRLGDERRYDVPVTVVCPEFSPEQARGWIDSGDISELAKAKHVELVDIDSGHWPMLTRPAELAGILARA